MAWYHYFVLFASTVFLLNMLWHLVRLIRAGKPADHARPAGKTGPAIVYAFTGAMSPGKKESAYLHLPTYAAGLIYHLGTFLAILVFVLIWFVPLNMPPVPQIVVPAIAAGFSCGAGILVKRMRNKGLRSLSSPDDYLSNILVNLFQFFTALVVLDDHFMPAYAVVSGILLLYFPLGKLKHALYFFAARYHLGVFFGSRGVWPPKTMQ